MAIKIVQGNLFDAKSGAVILTVDGSHRGAEGNLVRMFERRFPDAWEEVDYEIQYPIPLGSSRIYSIHPDVDCQFNYVIIASTLHHIQVLNAGEKKNVIGSALGSALLLASAHSLKVLNTAVMSGGWRLGLEQAVEEMLCSYFRVASLNSKAPSLKIFLHNKLEYNQALDYIKANYYVDNGCIYKKLV